ncbi:MAG: GWxTD domain-containing protein, partial [Bacteroidota bacterium]
LTLLDDAAQTAVTYRDRVSETDFSAQFVSVREVRSRLSRSRFDLDQRGEIATPLDASAASAEAADDARDHAAALAEAGALSPIAGRFALAAAVARSDWEAVRRLGATLGPVDPARARLAEGLALHRLGDAEAAAAAFEAALAALPEAEAARLLDLTPLLTPDEQAAYRADPAAVAEAFWAREDPRRLTDANERRAEHLARTVEADVLFGRTAGDLFTDRPLRGAQTEPGRIWIRYGRPLRSASFTLSTDDVPAYAEDLFGQQTPPYAVWEYDGFRFVFDDPNFVSDYRTYSPPAAAFSSRRYGTAVQNDDYVAQDRRMQRDDPAQTQVRPDVEVPVLVSRFRRSDGSTEAVVAYGAAVEDLEDAEAGVFALADGATVAQAPGRLGGGGRTLRTEAGALATGAATVPLAGADALRAEVAVGDTWGASDVPVEPLGGGFGLSDLLLAASVDEGTGGSVVRDGLSITPVPLGVFRVGDPVHVYVEAYGLAVEDGRTRYTVEASLVPAARRGGLIGRIFGRGQRPAVSVAADEEGSRATEAAHRVIDTADQRPGTYTLRLTVTDRATGEAASAERVVTLE